MSKRQYTSEFKAKVVLEILRGEEDLGAIALKNQINPNLLRTWRAAFLEKAPSLFEESKAARQTAEREREAAEEKAAMLKTIGQLTLERDFLMAEAHERNRKVPLRRG
jgi:transposase-like protein